MSQSRRFLLLFCVLACGQAPPPNPPDPPTDLVRRLEKLIAAKKLEAATALAKESVREPWCRERAQGGTGERLSATLGVLARKTKDWETAAHCATHALHAANNARLASAAFYEASLVVSHLSGEQVAQFLSRQPSPNLHELDDASESGSWSQKPSAWSTPAARKGLRDGLRSHALTLHPSRTMAGAVLASTTATVADVERALGVFAPQKVEVRGPFSTAVLARRAMKKEASSGDLQPKPVQPSKQPNKPAKPGEGTWKVKLQRIGECDVSWFFMMSRGAAHYYVPMLMSTYEDTSECGGHGHETERLKARWIEPQGVGTAYASFGDEYQEWGVSRSSRIFCDVREPIVCLDFAQRSTWIDIPTDANQPDFAAHTVGADGEFTTTKGLSWKELSGPPELQAALGTLSGATVREVHDKLTPLIAALAADVSKAK